MNTLKGIILAAGLSMLAMLQLQAQNGGAATENPIQWDAKLKEYQAKEEDTEANFTFKLKNTASHEVVINNVRTSCGCTVAKLPSQPWPLAAGEEGEIGVTVNLRGKYGTITKSVFVDTTAGMQALTVRVQVPGDPPSFSRGRPRMQLTDRQRNQLMALRNNQAIFHNDCATCHAEPAKGKMDAELYDAACGICHDSPNRGSMVPDLKNLPHATSRAYLNQWIRYGKKGSMMPGFLNSEGGPLTEAQVESLVDFLEESLNGTETAKQEFDDLIPPLFPEEEAPSSASDAPLPLRNP